MKKLVMVLGVSLTLAGMSFQVFAGAPCRLPQVLTEFQTEAQKQQYEMLISKTQTCFKHYIDKNNQRINDLEYQISELHSENEEVSETWNKFLSKVK